MKTASGNGAGEQAQPYSLSELKEADELLRRRLKEGGEVSRLLDDVEEFLRRGSMTGLHLDSLDDRVSAQGRLDYWVPVLYRAKRTPPDSTLAEFDPELLPELKDEQCPYRGLNAFREEDGDLFFGRRRLVEQLLQCAQTKRLLFIVGPSGSGKSSLVLAGLIPELKRGGVEGSREWRYFPRLAPGSNPLRSLAASLRKFYGRAADWEGEQIRKFQDDPDHLLRLISDGDQRPAVFIVDQFEEVYTLGVGDDVRDAFINNLVGLAQAAGPRHLVVFTMRAEYESLIAQTPALVPLFEQGQLRVTSPTASELREAIEEPARRRNLKFEDGLVEALVKDILGETEGLPLLQFTLLQLWRLREGGRNRVTWKNYRELGGARQALALTADNFYNHLPVSKKEAVKRILLRLARPSGNLEVTSNPVKRSTLYFMAPVQVDDALDELNRAGLIRITKGDTKEDDLIEVAHEALVRNWPLLIDWLDKERARLRQRVRLTPAAEQWRDHGKDEGGLLGGELLKEALKYDDLSALEKEFVRASEEAEERAALEKKEAEQEKKAAEERARELKEEAFLALQQKAAEVAKNARRLRLFLLALGVVTLFALGAAAFAREQSNKVSLKSEELEGKNQELQNRSEQLKGANETLEKNRKKLEDQAVEMKKANDLLTQTLSDLKIAKNEAEKKRLYALSQQKIAEAKTIEAKKANDRLQGYLDKERKDKTLAQEQADRAKQKNNLITEASELFQNKKFKDALARYEELRELGNKNGDRAGEAFALTNMVICYRNLGDKQKEDETTKQVKEFYEKDLNDQEPKFLQRDLSGLARYEESVQQLADFYDIIGDLEQEITIQERAVNQELSIYDQTFNQSVYNRLNGLAELYIRQGRLDLAEGEYRQALEMVKGFFQKPAILSQEDGGLVVESLDNLAGLYLKQGQYQKAGPLYDVAVADLPRKPGAAGRPQAEKILERAAAVKAKLNGPPDEVEALYKRILDLYADDESPSSNSYINALNELAKIQMARGDMDGAKSSSLGSLKSIEKNALSGAKVDVAKPLNEVEERLRAIYEKTGEDKESSNLDERVLNIKATIFGKDSPQVYDSHNEIAERLIRRGKTQEAEIHYKVGLKIAENFGANGRSFVLNSLTNLLGLYVRAERYKDADEIYTRLLETLGNSSQPAPQDVVPTLGQYAILLRKQNRAEDAARVESRLQSIKTIRSQEQADPCSRATSRWKPPRGLSRRPVLLNGGGPPISHPA